MEPRRNPGEGDGNSGSSHFGNDDNSLKKAYSSSCLLLYGGSGITGGQNSVAFGAVPPYFSSTCAMLKWSTNSSGLLVFKILILRFVYSSKNPLTILQRKLIELGQLIT